jgi:O-antigen/teichoic acid export membrane protein
MRDLRGHQSAAAGTAVLMGAIALAAPLNYGFGLALAWLLPAAEFGVVSVLLTVLLLATSVLAAGFPWALARRVARDESGAAGSADAAAAFRAALLGNVGLGAALAAGFVGVQLATGAILPGAGPGLTALVAVTIVLLALGQVLVGGLQGARRFTAVSAARVAEVVVKVGVGVAVVALLGAGVVGVASALLVGAVAAAAIAWWMVRDRLPRLRGPVAGWRSFAAAAPMAAATAGFGLIGTLDVLLLGVLGDGHGVTVAAIGSYQAAAILAKAPFLVGSTVSDVVFPFLARARGAAEAHGWFVTGLRWVPLALVPMLLVLIVTPDSLIGRLFPAEYADAAGPARLIALGTLGLIVGDMLLKALVARGLAGAAARRIPAAAAAEVATMALLVPAHGALGAAAGFVVGAWVGVGVLGAVYLRHHPVGLVPWRPVLAWVTATAVLTGALLLAAGFSSGLDLLLIAGGLLGYASLVVGLGAVPAADVARVRGVLGRLVGGRRGAPVEAGDELRLACATP